MFLLQWTCDVGKKGEKLKVKARFGEDPMFSKLFSLKTKVFPPIDLRCGERKRKTVVESSWRQDGGSGERSARFGEDPMFSKVFRLRTDVFSHSGRFGEDPKVSKLFCLETFFFFQQWTSGVGKKKGER